MLSYNINSWKPIIYEGSLKRYPSIFIQPNQQLLDHIKQNNNLIRVQIFDTDSNYDNYSFDAIVDDNVISVDGYIVISLLANWYGYPSRNGVATI